MILLRHIDKRYGRGPKVLQGLDLSVGEGEFVAVIGPSGCGKSTLLNLIGGLDRAEGGNVTVAGQDLNALSDPELARFRNSTIGFVFQTFHLHPRLTALENVALPALIAGLPTAEARARARERIEHAGLSAVGGHRPEALSGGQMQRVAIARALVMRPRILLADEPTGNLDQATGGEILRQIKALNEDENLTILLVTHEPATRAYATRTLTMTGGRIQ